MSVDYQMSELKTLKVHSWLKQYIETDASKDQFFISQIQTFCVHYQGEACYDHNNHLLASVKISCSLYSSAGDSPIQLLSLRGESKSNCI